MATKLRGVQTIACRQLEGVSIRYERHETEEGEKVKSFQAAENEGRVAIIVIISFFFISDMRILILVASFYLRYFLTALR